MGKNLARFKEIMGEVYDISHASALLGWDQQTYMPAGGAEDRGYQLATLAKIEHQLWTSEETGRLLEDLEKDTLPTLAPDSDDARLIVLARDLYNKRTRVPAAWIGEFTRLTTEAQQTWMKARQNSDFSSFQPALERIVEMNREYAQFFAPYQHVYDPLLDMFEHGMTTAEVQAIFKQVRAEQVQLLKEIAARPQVDDSFLHIPYPEKAQWDFGVEVITAFGFDWQRGRQDKSAHPFTNNSSIDDVRITTRFEPDSGMSALFSTMHEGGHAMYEQGIDPSLRRSPLAGGTTMAIHESQSRLWENLVGRSLPFWKHFFPRIQQAFPAQLGNVDLMRFYRGINRVEPSLIRVEADEATYNMHIMLRMELEIAMMEGTLAVKDLPEAWNARMQEYLGVTPPTDALGVLQDIHWSGGMMGYFPTYALGNLVSAQLWEQIHKDLPDLDAQMEQGKFNDLLGWLREKIHRHGSKFTAQELVQRATGSKITPEPYLRYLRQKYSQIYS